MAWTIPLIIFIICRSIAVFMFFAAPLAAGLLTIFLDAIDGNLLFITFEMPRDLYQNYDKIMDLVSYAAMLIIGLRLPIRKYVIAAFVYRTIGQILFFITQNDRMFFFFPNFLELPFIAYFMFKKFGREIFFLKYQILVYLILGFIKLGMEYSIHYTFVNWVGFFCGLAGLGCR